MEKKKLNILKMSLIQLAIIAVFAAMALGSSPKDTKDFQDGFRKGWNSTAPPEYRY